jgi:WD40 repeat protein
MVISESHSKRVNKVAVDEGNRERFAAASEDGTIRVWDITEYVVISTAVARKEQARGATPLCLAFADMLYSGWSDGKSVTNSYNLYHLCNYIVYFLRVLAHSAETGENLWILDNAHPSDGGVTAMALSHNRRFLLTGGQAGEVRLWELRSRELISHLKEHKLRITSLALFNDDTMALSASRDRCILRWDLKTEVL